MSASRLLAGQPLPLESRPGWTIAGSGSWRIQAGAVAREPGPSRSRGPGTRSTVRSKPMSLAASPTYCRGMTMWRALAAAGRRRYPVSGHRLAVNLDPVRTRKPSSARAASRHSWSESGRARVMKALMTSWPGPAVWLAVVPGRRRGLLAWSVALHSFLFAEAAEQLFQFASCRPRRRSLRPATRMRPSAWMSTEDPLTHRVSCALPVRRPAVPRAGPASASPGSRSAQLLIASMRWPPALSKRPTAGSAWPGPGDRPPASLAVGTSARAAWPAGRGRLGRAVGEHPRP